MVRVERLCKENKCAPESVHFSTKEKTSGVHILFIAPNLFPGACKVEKDMV